MKTSTQEHAQPGSELTLGNVGQILTVFTVEKFPNAKRGSSELVTMASSCDHQAILSYRNYQPINV